MRNVNKEKGLTIVELLVALALSTTLAAAVYQIVINNRMNVVVIDSHAKVQESARLAIDLLSRDLRMAGYMGCVSNLDNAKNNLSTDPAKNYDPELHNFSSTFSGDNNVALNSKTIGGVTVKAGTDYFSSRSASTVDLIVQSQPVGGGAKNIKFANKQKVGFATKGAVLMVSDCVKANIFVITGTRTSTNSDTVTHNTGNNAEFAHNAVGTLDDFAPGSQALVMNSFSFFVAPSAVVKDANGNAVDSLYKYSILGGDSAVELVPYVEDLQFSYGLDSNGDRKVDTYKEAPTVDEFKTITAIKFDLVISGPQDVEAARSIATVAGAATADDGVMRKRYSSVVQIRNRNLAGGTVQAATP